MDMSSASYWNRQSRGSSHFMQVKKGEVRVRLKHMNVIIANGNNLSCHSGETVIVGDAFKECCAALYFVDMRLRRDHLPRHTEITEAQFNPSFP